MSGSRLARGGFLIFMSCFSEFNTLNHTALHQWNVLL